MAITYYVMNHGPAIFQWTDSHADWNSAFAFATGGVHPSECFWMVPGTWDWSN
jgi:hypothetical protein